MSTSPRRVVESSSVAEPSACEVLPFPYDAASVESGRDPAHGEPDFATRIAAQQETAREVQRMAELRQAVEIEAQKSFVEQLARERSSIAQALARFTRDRAVYFEKIEGEVVQLALSIARKILHREAQVDPLLLAGVVRVALDKIDKASRVILRIHPQNAADWRSYLATQLDPANLPDIVEDKGQPLDGCLLETSMGVASFGLEVQLKEIEQGLMDLLAARPETQL